MPASGPEQPESQAASIAQAITEISERASLLVREEIELAKAEVTAKLTKLVRGAVVGIAAGIFVVTGLLFLLHSAAWQASSPHLWPICRCLRSAGQWFVRTTYDGPFGPHHQ